MKRRDILSAVAALFASSGCVASTGSAGLEAGNPAALAATPSPCKAAGPAQLVAPGVFVPAGVEARLENGEATVQFALHATRCAEARLSVDGWRRSDDGLGECPAKQHDVVATSDGETMLARQSQDATLPRVTLGVVVYDAPRAVFGFAVEGRSHVVERTFEAPAGVHGSGETNPALVPIRGERFLLTWVDGDVESHRLHGQVVAGWGKPVGAALDLSPGDVSVVGRPSVVVGADGRGIVAFLASNGHGFDALATPIACESK
jgi:hypothetical protein